MEGINIRTLDIVEITDEYEQSRQIHNDKIIKKYGPYVKKCAYSDFLLRKESFIRLFCIEVLHDDGKKELIQFGYEHKHDKPLTIMCGNIKYMNEYVEEKIKTFCKMYETDILDGKVIKEIVLNDTENVLNYNPQNKVLTKIMGKFQKK